MRRELQRRSWIAQRAGWLALALMLSSALAGLAGPGPLSRAFAQDEDGALRVEYNRVDHYASRSKLSVIVAAGHARDGRLRLRFNEGYLRAMRVEQVLPEPERVEAAEDGIYFVFAALAAQRPTRIDFDMQPSEFGRVEGRIGLPGRSPARFTQFLFP